MANGFIDALGRFGRGFALGMAPADVRQEFFRQREMERQQGALNPIRQAVLGELIGPANTFSGGPASEIPGIPGGAPLVTPAGPQAAPVSAQPIQPEQPGRPSPTNTRPRGESPRPLPASLPANLRPPPDIDAALQEAAQRHGVPVNALRAIAAQESGGHGFRANVVGETAIDLPGQEGDRALGIFQFTPQTTRGIRERIDPNFDPRDPAKAADQAARMLREEMERGSSLEEAMTAHFGGPNRELWGSRTQRYMQDVASKFQTLEQAASQPEQAGQPAQPTSQGPQVATGGGQQVGPFGTAINPQQEPQGLGRRLLAEAARNPETFAELFATGGVEQIAALAQGGQAEQIRVISGDSPEGRAIGLQPGERARVKGQMTGSGQFFPMEVVAAPFGGAAEGGPLVNLFDLATGEVTSRRRDDPEVDQLIQRGAVIVPDGAGLAQLEQMSTGERRELNNAQIATRNYIDTSADLLSLLEEQPDINTITARGAAIINDFRQEARAIARAMGTEFDEGIFDVSIHADAFRQLGIDNERVQSLITSLAFQRAVAEKGGSGRISNRDIERFIAEVGGRSSDPVALAQTLLDTAERTSRAFRTRYEVVTGSPFEGDLGERGLPRFNDADFEERARRRMPIQQPAPDTEVGPAPEGVDPELWQFMTPEERALWQN